MFYFSNQWDTKRPMLQFFVQNEKKNLECNLYLFRCLNLVCWYIIYDVKSKMLVGDGKIVYYDGTAADCS